MVESSDIAKTVFALLESNIRVAIHKEDNVALETFTQLEKNIFQIVDNITKKKNSDKTQHLFGLSTNQAVGNNTSVWNPLKKQTTGSRVNYGSNMMNYGRQAFQTMQNTFSSIVKPPAPTITEVPETFATFQGDENVVQMELHSRSGAQNVVNKIGLVGLKQLGDAFEPISDESPMEMPASSS